MLSLLSAGLSATTVKAHSTQGVAASTALLSGVSVEDIFFCLEVAFVPASSLPEWQVGLDCRSPNIFSNGRGNLFARQLAGLDSIAPAPMVADLIEAVLLLRFLSFFHGFMEHGLKRSSYRLTFSLGYSERNWFLLSERVLHILAFLSLMCPVT